MLGHNPEVIRRFGREAEAQKNLKSPYLVELISADFQSQPPALVMEWIDGGVLGDLSSHGAPPPPALVRQVARDILEGAHALHLAGLVHRDIKPDNVFLRKSKRAVLGDLGMVGTEVASTISRTGIALGTPKYMPPEVLRGYRWSPAGDLFSIGLTLWEFATGIHPNQYFDQSLTMFLDPAIHLPSLEEAGAYRNPTLELLLENLLERDPDRRPPDASFAQELLGDEKEALSQDAEALRAWSPPRPPGSSGSNPEDQTAVEGLDTGALALRNAETGPVPPSEVSSTQASAPPSKATSPLTKSTGTRPQKPLRGALSTTHALPPEALSPPSPQDPAPKAPAALAPRILTGLVAGTLVCGAVLWVSRTPGEGRVVLAPEPTRQNVDPRQFPEDFIPASPEWYFLSPSRVEFRWNVPVKAFAVGTSQSAQGIQEFARGPSTKPTLLSIPAPPVGTTMTRFTFRLEDREGNQVRSAVSPQLEVASLLETAEKFLKATEDNRPLRERKEFFHPLKRLLKQGGIRDFDADLHHKLVAASSDL